MQDILAQVIPAGPGDDAEGWMNILFVVVLAVFWVISGVIKATSKRPQDRQKQQASRKPIREVPRSTTPRDPSPARPTRKTQDRPQMRPRPVSQAAQLEKALETDRDLIEVLKTANELIDLCRATQRAYLDGSRSVAALDPSVA